MRKNCFLKKLEKVLLISKINWQRKKILMIKLLLINEPLIKKKKENN